MNQSLTSSGRRMLLVAFTAGFVMLAAGWVPAMAQAAGPCALEGTWLGALFRS